MADEPERNDLCPCGSGLKYKKCFLMSLETCPLFDQTRKGNLMKEHAEKDKMIFRFFRETTEDIGTVFARNNEGQEVVASRAQLVAIFTLVDVISSYWYEYLNQTGKQSERFISWVNEFCFTPNNPEYTGSIFENFSPERLYEFRNSTVHFFGLAVGSEDTFAITPNNEQGKKLMEGFVQQQKNKGKTIHMIDSKKLHDLLSEGGILMLNGWSKIIEDAQADEDKKLSHIKGIDRIHKKVMLEGAVKIPYK